MKRWDEVDPGLARVAATSKKFDEGPGRACECGHRHKRGELCLYPDRARGCQCRK